MANVVIGPNRELTIVVLLNGHTNLLLSMFRPIDKCYSQPWTEKLLFSVKGSECRDSWLFQVLRLRERWCLSLNRTFHRPPLRPEIIKEERVDRMRESGDRKAGECDSLGIETQLLPSWAQAPADALTVHTEHWPCREPGMEERLMAPSPSLGNYWLLRTHWKVHKTQEDSSTPAVLQWLNSVDCKTKRHGYRKVSCKEEEGT